MPEDAGWQPAYPPPPPNDQPYYARPQASSRSTLVFVLGILGLVVCFPLAIAAWVVGAGERNQALARGEQPDGLTTAGWVLGIIGTVWFLICLLFLAALLIGSVTVR